MSHVCVTTAKPRTSSSAVSAWSAAATAAGSVSGASTSRRKRNRWSPRTQSACRHVPSASSTRAWRASSNQATPTVPHGACGTTASKIVVDAVVQRVDELLGRRRSALRPGHVVECRQFRAPTAGAGPQNRSCFIELPGDQELEGRLTTSGREKGHPVAPCVTSIRSAHDLENPEQVLFRDGIRSSAAGPGVHALWRYPEELPKLGPGQSTDATQFRDRTSRSLACVFDRGLGTRLLDRGRRRKRRSRDRRFRCRHQQNDQEPCNSIAQGLLRGVQGQGIQHEEQHEYEPPADLLLGFGRSDRGHRFDVAGQRSHVFRRTGVGRIGETLGPFLQMGCCGGQPLIPRVAEHFRRQGGNGSHRPPHRGGDFLQTGELRSCGTPSIGRRLPVRPDLPN